MLRNAPENEQIKQLVYDILGGNSALDQDGKAFPGVFIDYS